MTEPVKAPVDAWRHPLTTGAGWVATSIFIVWVLTKVSDGLFIPWWFNTDEVVFYYEVIRQLRLDFSQTFFDIPGTPYMTLTSLLVLPWWAVERVMGLTAASPADFAFEHVQGVYTLMRGITFAGYVLAIGLSYELFRRISGALTGAIAAVLTCTLPIHIHYSHFVRTESLGLVLCLVAIIAMVHPRTRRSWKTYLFAGVLAGIAMGARFHFALVGLPVLLVIYFLKDRLTLDLTANNLPAKQLRAAGFGLAGLFVAGAIITLLFKAGVIAPGMLTHTMLLSSPGGPELYAEAKHTVSKLWILLGAVSLMVGVMQIRPRERSWLLPVINPFTLALLLGFAGGFLLSHPTFLWRGEHQLRSIQFYSDWVDPELETLGTLGSWWKVTVYYFTTALPERWVQVLFMIGALAILWRRQVAPLAFLGGALVCFVAHPVTMKLWPHHIIPWLPFLCYVAAYPVGLALSALPFVRRHPALPALVLIGAMTLLGTGLSSRLATADSYLNTSRARTVQIEEMNQWLQENVPLDAFMAVSYFALNGDGFLKWIESAGVAVPDYVKRHRDVNLWWLARSTLDGRKGYVCISRADIAFFSADAERKNPGSTYDPFENPRFTELAAFGGGFYELKVFKFDLREPANP